MKREEQMMEEAEAYAAGLYADEPVSFSTEESKSETICDFRAGWMAADRHPNWIPVEEKLPKETGWYLVVTPTLNSKIDVALWDGKWRRLITITHWMPLPQPPKKGGEK